MSLNNATRSATRVLPPFLGRLAPPAASQNPVQQLPEWLLNEPEPPKQPQPSAGTQASLNASQPKAATAEANGVKYEVYIGARLKLYSSRDQEAKLRGMVDTNHRELPIARLAARVADYLWPNCQQMIDEAVASSKRVTKARAAADEEFVPPSVPHFLPVTYWLSNNEVIRESFICDKNTRYKPRMTWYNPNDGMFPTNWWSEGFLGDLAYYKPLSGTRQPHQKW